MRFILVALVFAGLAACSPASDDVLAAPPPPSERREFDAGGGKSIDEMRAESLRAVDRKACEAAGGDVRQEGLLGLYRCVLKYADAGKTCRANTDCEGRCLADDGVTLYGATAGEARGRCEADDSPFGCFAEIEDGTVGQAICVD